MLRAFEAYGRTGGIRKAAQSLGVTHTIISRHLRGLEEWLGTTLINRRSGTLTSRGQYYHREIAAAIGTLTRASTQLRAPAAGVLTISCATGFACNWLVYQLDAFRKICRGVDLVIRPDNVPSDFDRDDVHADIRYLRPSERLALPPHLRAVEIARPQVFPVTHAALAREINHRIRAPGDLLAEPLIEENDDHEWVTWFQAQSVSVSAINPCARLWHATLTLAAAKDAQGLAMTNIFLTGADLASGSLAQVHLPDAPWRSVTIGSYFIVAPVANWQSRTLNRFNSWLADATAAFKSSVVLTHID
ncbi:LysR family transcriptional regulator [Gluconacetobacter liquefaciens NRIC 0522]|nr:LysR family transcriptional regulator [Gluconacetobacter liquefaciens NRIC 0522]